jgi:hypothetical protein
MELTFNQPQVLVIGILGYRVIFLCVIIDVVVDVTLTLLSLIKI